MCKSVLKIFSNACSSPLQNFYVFLTTRSFHPDFHNPSSKVQREVLELVRTWINGFGHQQNDVIARLTKESVRSHNNVRLGSDGGPGDWEGSFAANQAHHLHSSVTGYVSQLPGVQQAQNVIGKIQGVGGSFRDIPSQQDPRGYQGPPQFGPPA